MIVTPFKTHKITSGENIFEILDRYLPEIRENSVIAIASKIISISQGNIITEEVSKEDLIKEQADLFYIDPIFSNFPLVIPTITNNILVANAGIDESNVEKGFLLWPKNITEITNHIWMHLRKQHNLKNVGVLITDSRLTPLAYGITGVGIAWCGFEPLQDYRGTPDIFGKELKMSYKSVLNGLAASAVVVTGEGNEQTPLAVISEVPFVTFQNRPPTKEELDSIWIAKEDDIYGKMLNSVKWEKGGGKS